MLKFVVADQCTKRHNTNSLPTCLDVFDKNFHALWGGGSLAYYSRCKERRDIFIYICPRNSIFPPQMYTFNTKQADRPQVKNYNTMNMTYQQQYLGSTA